MLLNVNVNKMFNKFSIKPMLTLYPLFIYVYLQTHPAVTHEQNEMANHVFLSCN